MDTDVLIVGAGPTGLMLANQLMRWGVRVIIIDRHAGPARETRALGVQARTLEIYQKLGIVDRALELGKVGTGADIWANGRHMARLPLGDAGEGVTPFPYILILGQDDNEKIMGERLNAQGLKVRWNTELVTLTQDGDTATALVREAGVAMSIKAAWIAGCDGAHSAVREQTGITFPGAPYEHVFFVADTEVTGTMVPDEVNAYLFKNGFHLLFPMRGKDHWRVVGILPPELHHEEGLTFEAVVPSLHANAGSTLQFGACSWFSTYRIHHRAAAHFRKDRCFVLGDAAHIHSPVGAQGMNTGLQDAYNLAWKLALVVKGKARATLLDTYEDERLPVAQRLLNTTDRGFKVVVSDRWGAGLLRSKILARVAAFAMSLKRIQAFAFRTISQTGIRYRHSRLSQALSAYADMAPHAGDRFPWLKLKFRADGPVEDTFHKLDDTHFHLLVFDQDLRSTASLGFGGLLHTHVFPSDPANDAVLTRAHIPHPSFYLLRPDGHVGLCGARLDPALIKRYMTERIGMVG